MLKTIIRTEYWMIIKVLKKIIVQPNRKNLRRLSLTHMKVKMALPCWSHCGRGC
jgi:hypothetical protein